MSWNVCKVERECVWGGHTVGEAARTSVAAFPVVAAHVAEDYYLAVVADHGVAEDLGRFDAIAAVVRRIGKRGSEA